MSHSYRIEKTEDGGVRVHFGESTNFPFSITDDQEIRATERANIIACQLRRQEREFLKSIRHDGTQRLERR